jgi:hypothetical protein
MMLMLMLMMLMLMITTTQIATKWVGETGIQQQCSNLLVGQRTQHMPNKLAEHSQH